MRAGSGILLVALGLFVIYLGATGKLSQLGNAFGVLMGKQTASTPGATTTAAMAPNTGFPVSPGVLSYLSSLWGSGPPAAAAGLNGAGGSSTAVAAVSAMA